MRSTMPTTDRRTPRFPVATRALSSLREAVRRRRTDRRDVAREIAAYPATRSAALAVPAARRSGAA